MQPKPSDSPSGQPTEMMPSDTMEDLQPKPAPALPPRTPSSEETGEIENAETRLEEAKTVKYAISKLNDFLRWFIAVLEVTLLIRFILRLIGADPKNMFAGFLYALTDIILVPFQTILRNPSLVQNQAFEWSTLIAMAIYYLVFWAIRRFLHILISNPEESTT